MKRRNRDTCKCFRRDDFAELRSETHCLLWCRGTRHHQAAFLLVGDTALKAVVPSHNTNVGKLLIQAVPLAQTVFKVEADSLHLTLVGRFVYDVMHFVTEAREIASVLSTPSPAAVPDTQKQPADSYRPITEVGHPA